MSLFYVGSTFELCGCKFEKERLDTKVLLTVGCEIPKGIGSYVTLWNIGTYIVRYCSLQRYILFEYG